MAKSIGPLRALSEENNWTQQGISRGDVDQHLREYVITFLGKHAGLVVDESVRQLWVASQEAWRSLFGIILQGDFNPNPKAVQLFKEKKEALLRGPEAGQQPQPQQQQQQQPAVVPLPQFAGLY